MKARAELEIYRRFTGSLRRHPLRFWPIVTSNIRVATKRRRALALFCAVPTIATIVGCVFVYLTFTQPPQPDLQVHDVRSLLSAGTLMAQVLDAQFFQVRTQIFAVMAFLTGISTLATAWFGSGLLCEDKRVGAHLLYFTRPLTRLDYFLGKFLTVAFFSGLIVLLPGLVLCIFATFVSPDWSFLKREWDLYFRTLLYALAWVTTAGSMTLCVSSLASRRVFALIGAFAFFVLVGGSAGVLGEFVDHRYRALSPMENVQVIACHLFKQPGPPGMVSLELASLATAAFVALALLIVARRIRRWEVVG